MISDKKIAITINDLMNKINGDLNDSIILVKDNCNNEDFLKYRETVGIIMGRIFVDVLMSIYKEHPELDSYKE